MVIKDWPVAIDRQSTLDKGRGMEDGLAAGEYFAYWPVMLKADLAHA